MRYLKTWAFLLMFLFILTLPVSAVAEPRRGPLLYNGQEPGYEVKWRITSGFGSRVHPVYGYRHFHQGIDLVPVNTRRYKAPVVSTTYGTVIFSGYLQARGYTVIVRGEEGFLHIYQHLYRQSELEPLGEVEPFDLIGGAGSTGVSSGIHLHYEVWCPEDEPVDPLAWLKGIYLD